MRREGRRCELVSLFAEQARLAQRVTQIVREADDDGDWRAAGCSSSAQWLAQVSSSDHRTRGADHADERARLRSLPALDHAMSTGALTLDQVAAAAEFATPESDAELARVAVGKPPSAIGAGRAHARAAGGRGRPGAVCAAGVEHDVDAGAARAVPQRPVAARAGRVFEQAIWDIAKHAARRSTSRPAACSTWQQSAADALVTLAQRGGGERGGVRRSATTLIVHLSDDAAAVPRGRRADQPRDRRTARLRRAPPHDQAERTRPRPLARRTLRVLRAAARAAQALRPLPVPRLHRHPRARGTPPRRRRVRRQDRARQPDPALPPTPQTPPRPATSTPAAPATQPDVHRRSRTRRSPPTNHTHHPSKPCCCYASADVRATTLGEPLDALADLVRRHRRERQPHRAARRPAAAKKSAPLTYGTPASVAAASSCVGVGAVAAEVDPQEVAAVGLDEAACPPGSARARAAAIARRAPAELGGGALDVGLEVARLDSRRRASPARACPARCRCRSRSGVRRVARSAGATA